MQLTAAQKNIIACAETGMKIIRAEELKGKPKMSFDGTTMIVPRSTIERMIRRGLLKPHEQGFATVEATPAAKSAYERSRVVWFSRNESPKPKRRGKSKVVPLDLTGFPMRPD